ncbi:transmembrane protein, putative [Medicago truncatula]|uniref:Transmembrane protein, putative n=1 Tax=Medicago truncatula TaxID=3880 RepID=A0A072U6S1_MEDTR|nr:transmembrane protein, putative [Medicago truncatula]
MDNYNISESLRALEGRDGKTIINLQQSGVIGVRTPVMTSGVTISIFLSVELGLMGQIYTTILVAKHFNF